MAENTPMKLQYDRIRQENPSCLLFFRLGDFYEMFDDDAIIASKELDLTLTTRDRGRPQEEQTPMCGVPFHSAEAYIGRLIAKGYKVAICEQTEDPAKAKGLVRREVIRVVSPGTVVEGSMLDERASNYICAVFIDGSVGGCAFCDVSTGEFCAAGYESGAVNHIINELGRFSPKEALLSVGASDSPEIDGFLKKRLSCCVNPAPERFDYLAACLRICSQFHVETIDELRLGDTPGAVCAAGALLSYLSETQKCELTHINRLELFAGGRYMELDYVARRNLELTETMRGGDRRGSLLWVLDKTRTPMGGRLLRSWVERPLLFPAQIKRRLDAVEELYKDNVLRPELMLMLKDVGDMQRLAGRCVYASANARDLLALGLYLSRLPALFERLSGAKSALLANIAATEPVQDVYSRILRAICDEPPISVRDGGMLREGYSEEVDRLRNVRDNGAQLISELEKRERERTGIKKLKVSYNKVFGYYIDVPRSASETVPDDYIRKQTLVSNERYFTKELKELEDTLMTAKDRIAELEYGFFCDVRDRAAAEITRIQAASEAVAMLDVLCALAEVAQRNGYTKPEIDLSRGINIVQGRHPVVEETQKDTLFVPNDTRLSDGDDRVAVITGPNMAGKSTYMRQTALIVLMAQMGSFVPAKSATIGIVDRVFTRIGASDDLSAGQSTFMVEMSELADILKNATPASLLILDEIGRGTSTFDGMAVALAVLEWCADKKKLGAKTMFATHYHELSAMEDRLSGVRNYNITAKKQNGELIFLRKIVPGAADDSYGIEVAKLAGIPEGVIKSAKKHLAEFESGRSIERQKPRTEPEQVSLGDMGAFECADRLRMVSPDTLTPIEALNLVYELKKLL